MRTTTGATATGLCLLLLAGCHTPREQRDGVVGNTAGGTKSVNPAAMAKNVDVVLREMEIGMPHTLVAGPTTFRVRNAGTTAHGFAVEGQGIDEKLGQPLQPNQQATLHVDLRPGSYRVYCPVDQHAARGMQLQLTVTPRETR